MFGIVRAAILMGAVLAVGVPQAVSQPEIVRPRHVEVMGAADRLRLPAPRRESSTSLERALAIRMSVRSFKDTPLNLDEVSQLLWAAQGVTAPREGFRTATSAGATYPLELYLVAGDIHGVSAGVYRYRPLQHDLVKVADGDVRAPLAAAALGQTCVARGVVVLIITAVYERTTRRYGERGIRYVHMEAGHAAQNVYLQAAALELGTVVIGAFTDDRVHSVAHLPRGEHPLYLMPVGRP
jgi:SagB-type dehydrogenase family enzyme